MKQLKSSLTYENSVKELRKRFPQLKSALQEKQDWWGNELVPQTIAYEDVFVPHIKLWANDRKIKENRDNLHNAMMMVEEMAISDEYNLRNLADVCVIEALVLTSQEFKRPFTLFKPKSAELAAKICQLYKI